MWLASVKAAGSVDLFTIRSRSSRSNFSSEHWPVHCGVIWKPLAVSLAAWLQASLDVTEVLVFERLDQLEKIHQQVLETEEEEVMGRIMLMVQQVLLQILDLNLNKQPKLNL